ncbi:hypothetical protein [Thauera aminoaromatica]|uniref:hypothetical protein n=1 Tax=Thauera aminoaromatica TaxID=164330 RepID=UPI0035AEB645
MMEKYAKTPKGQDEIAHRTHGLGLRARRLLILVDGQRSVEDLCALTGDAGIAAALGELAEAGFIASSAGMADPPEASIREGQPAAGAAPVARAHTGHTASLPLARDFMINTLRTFHGPYGKLGLVKRVHATRSSSELRALIAEWKESIDESRLGRKRADELLALLEEVLPG